MKFSLILCTINREKEVKNFLDSISLQTYKNFEIIIIDQNIDDRVLNILKEYNYLDIKYLKSKVGLSIARNLGLENRTGEIVCFPDDDCIYPSVLLENIYPFFKKNDYDILLGKTIDKSTDEIVAGKKTLKKQKLSTYFTLGSSTTLFIKNIRNNRFDEDFGLGAKYGSEEENELIFRLLKKGYKGYYNPEINYVYHPPSDLNFDDLTRIQERSIGLGAFIAKHLFTKEGIVYFFKFNLLRPLTASIIFFIKIDFIKSKFYFNKLIGIWKGFFKHLMK